jgi:hypothetical protein
MENLEKQGEEGWLCVTTEERWEVRHACMEHGHTNNWFHPFFWL